jgi:uncharacterized protein (DUF1684 family)
MVKLRVVWVALCVLALACGGQVDPGMISIAPPPDWNEEVRTAREHKDRHFLTSPTSPLLEADQSDFEGLSYWEPNPAFYWVGPLNHYVEPQQVAIPATDGEARPAERVGWIAFAQGKTEYRLEVYRLRESGSEEQLFLPFMDATSGADSYGAGRYVDLIGPRGGPYVLDFNRAFNPYCAYDPKYSCSLTPEENRITARIEAGERTFHGKGEHPGV